MLGDVSGKYESNNKWDTIGNIPGDRGGASYGPWQLSAGVGTLQKFLKSSKNYLKFAGLKPGESAFDAQWITMCKDPAFCTAQWQFIKDTHYTPVSKYWDSLALPHSNRIDEMLWSMSVQHGLAGNKKIIDAGYKAMPDNYTTEDAIRAMYNARRNYVSGLSMPDNIKNSLYRRYTAEMADVIKLQD